MLRENIFGPATGADESSNPLIDPELSAAVLDVPLLVDFSTHLLCQILGRNPALPRLLLLGFPRSTHIKYEVSDYCGYVKSIPLQQETTCAWTYRMNQKPHGTHLSLLRVKGFAITFFTFLLVLSRMLNT
jgi:hypothetical protein